ncbi:MAG: hypothetical protein HKN26_02035 [Acidimicrobiales bacterium]|nr:hypothetical protein [Acidimicrobiales bacterium]
MTTLRIFLHVLGASVWVGGQIVLGALVPTLRGIGGDAPQRAARQFGRVAWPFYLLVVATGIWNLLKIDVGDQDTAFHATLGIKLLLVALSGVAAFVHQSTDSPAMRGATGAGGFAAGLGALYCGVLLVT